MRRGALLALVLGLAAFAPIRGAGGAPASDPQFLILSPVGAFAEPTYVTSPPGDQDRLFVVQKGGVIKLVLDGVIQSTPFLDVTNLVMNEGEQGLFSIAFAPDYATSGLFYIDYTAVGTGAMTVDEFQRSASDPNVADPLSRRNVITIPHPGAANHNGGQLQFGPDGMLYISTGDGGGAGDPFRSAQNLLDRRGKILRIDPRQDGPNPYRIPPSNPFVGRSWAYPEIWSWGVGPPGRV
jgi:glucose/arabinose dehydrogenase